MKKLALITLLVMLTAQAAMAQIPRRRGYYRPAPVRPVPARPVHQGYSHSHAAPRATDIYYGLRLGLGVSVVDSDDRYLDGGSAKAGLNAGVVAGFQLAPAAPVYLETGLLYTEKGGKGSYDGHSFSYSLNYLEVPLVMKYRYDFDELCSLQPFAGLFVAAGVGGKMKDFNQRQAYSAFDKEGFQRFDGGLRLGVGLQFSYLYAEVGYDLGLANISHDYFDTAHTGSFFATMGVNF